MRCLSGLICLWLLTALAGSPAAGQGSSTACVSGVTIDNVGPGSGSGTACSAQFHVETFGSSHEACSGPFTLDTDVLSETTVKWNYGLSSLVKLYGDVGSVQLSGLGAKAIEVFAKVKSGGHVGCELTGNGAATTLTMKRQHRLDVGGGFQVAKAAVTENVSFRYGSVGIDFTPALGYEYVFHPLNSDGEAAQALALILADTGLLGVDMLPAVGPLLAGLLEYGDGKQWEPYRDKIRAEIGVAGKAELAKFDFFLNLGDDAPLSGAMEPGGIAGVSAGLRVYTWERENPGAGRIRGAEGVELTVGGKLDVPWFLWWMPHSALPNGQWTYGVEAQHEGSASSPASRVLVTVTQDSEDDALLGVEHSLPQSEYEISGQTLQAITQTASTNPIGLFGLGAGVVGGSAATFGLGILGFGDELDRAAHSLGSERIVRRDYAESVVFRGISPSLDVGAALGLGGGIRVGLQAAIGSGERYLSRTCEIALNGAVLEEQNIVNHTPVASEWEGEAGIVEFHKQLFLGAARAAAATIAAKFPSQLKWIVEQTTQVIQAAQGVMTASADGAKWLQQQAQGVQVKITSWIPDIPMFGGGGGAAARSVSSSGVGSEMAFRPYSSSRFVLSGSHRGLQGVQDDGVLVAVGCVHRVTVTDQAGTEITSYPADSTRVEITISTNELQTAGYEPADASNLRLFRFDDADDTWHEVVCTRTEDPGTGNTTLAAYVTGPGDYAAAIIGSPVDNAAPQVSITSPTAGSELTGIQTVTGTCSDNRGIASIAVSVGSTALAYPTISGSNWSCEIDTARLASGPKAITVTAQDAAGNTGAASVQVIFDNPHNDTPGSVKQSPRSTVNLAESVVTAGTEQMDGRFYVQDLSVPVGIRVNPISGTFGQGDRVLVAGVPQGAEGECEIAFADVVRLGEHNPLPSALGATSMWLGGGLFGIQPGVTDGFGLNNIGLLVHVWGRVTGIGTGCLYLDDGSNLKDGTSTSGQDNVGVRVICDATGYEVGDWLGVTGISSCFRTPSGNIARRVLARSAADIVGYRLVGGVFQSIATLKKAATGRSVSLATGVVTATAEQMGTFLYVEDKDRISGIRVNARDTRQLGDQVSASGVLTLGPSGELELAQASTGFLSHLDPLMPLGMRNSWLGGNAFGLQGAVAPEGYGLNNIGLLVRIWGKVTETDTANPATWFKIDDGSGIGVKCVVPDGVAIDPVWQWVGVTGISSCEKIGNELHRLLRVRQQSDITAF